MLGVAKKAQTAEDDDGVQERVAAILSRVLTKKTNDVNMKDLRARLRRLEPLEPIKPSVLTEERLRAVDGRAKTPGSSSGSRRARTPGSAAIGLSTGYQHLFADGSSFSPSSAASSPKPRESPSRRHRRKLKRQRERQKQGRGGPRQKELPLLQLDSLDALGPGAAATLDVVKSLGSYDLGARLTDPLPTTVSEIRKQYKTRFEKAKARLKEIQDDEAKWTSSAANQSSKGKKGKKGQSTRSKQQQETRRRAALQLSGSAPEVGTPMVGVLDSWASEVEVGEELEVRENLYPEPYRLELPTWTLFVSDEMTKMELLSKARKALLRGEVLQLVSRQVEGQEGKHLIRFLHAELRASLRERELPPFDTESESGTIKVDLEPLWGIDLAMEQGHVAQRRDEVLAQHSPSPSPKRRPKMEPAAGEHLLPTVEPPPPLLSPRTRKAARAARARRAPPPPPSAMSKLSAWSSSSARRSWVDQSGAAPGSSFR